MVQFDWQELTASVSQLHKSSMSLSTCRQAIGKFCVAFHMYTFFLLFPCIWHMLQVFQKIQKRLSHRLSKNSPEQLEQRLAKQYEEYLHTVNTTAGVFRDTIAAQIYDPLAPRSAQSLFLLSALPSGQLLRQ